MNDITVDQVKKGEEVLFFLKPNDKSPHCITRVHAVGYNHRGQPTIWLEGITSGIYMDDIPIYHVKKMPEDPALIKAHGAGIADKKVELIKGLDY